MDLNKISYGKNAPSEINVVIEIAQGSAPVKYEVDKESGALFVDRFISTPMFYPANYGFIPNTLSDDGDPADVLVLTKIPVIEGCVIPARPVGVLIMEDESGMDEKIIAVPTDKIHPFTKDIQKLEDIDQATLDQITHFFERYKDLEKGKWVKVKGFEGKAKAEELIQESIDRVKK
jgi:inorganic pyrophosphatase